MPVALLGGWDSDSKVEFLSIFDDFWTFIEFSQKLPVVLPNTELKPTPTLLESSPAHAAMFVSLRFYKRLEVVSRGYRLSLLQNTAAQLLIYV